MSLTDTITSKAQSIADAFAAVPITCDTPFVRNSRPFAIYLGSVTLFATGTFAVWKGDAVTAAAVVATVGIVMREFARFRSQDKQADVTADIENKKTITSAATTDKQTAALATVGGG